MTSPAASYCEDVTRSRARNFWYGIRLLPGPKREALAAIYALARRIDDIGDDGLPVPEAAVALDAVEGSLTVADPGSADPVLAAVGLARQRFPIPMDAFADLVAGVRMDLEGSEYRTFEELVVYCRRVAGSVGRLSLSVFGSAEMGAARPLADDLGVAMQLTNVLRDVREDLERGRTYLPRKDFERFGCSPTDLTGDGIEGLVRFEAARADDWFRRGLRLLPMLDRRSAACAGAMAGIYRRLLRRIADYPEAIVRSRVSLPGWEKALVAARALAAPGVMGRAAA
jgi:15-cis-phytoene synthase